MMAPLTEEEKQALLNDTVRDLVDSRLVQLSGGLHVRSDSMRIRVDGVDPLFPWLGGQPSGRVLVVEFLWRGEVVTTFQSPVLLPGDALNLSGVRSVSAVTLDAASG